MKKLISTLTALTLAFSSMAALSSNAAIFIYDSDSEGYQNIFDGYRVLDTDIAKSYFSAWSETQKYDAFYTNESGSRLIAARQLSSIVVFDLADGVSQDDVQHEVAAYCHNNETDLYYSTSKRSFTGFVEPDYSYEMLCGGVFNEPEYSVKLDDAKNICKILKEKNLISAFKYVNRNQLMYFDTVFTEYPLSSCYLSRFQDDKMPLIQSYLEENYSDCEVIVKEDTYGNQMMQVISPNENASVEELMEFAISLNEAMGDGVRLGEYLSPCAAGASPAASIDMYNAIAGDANCDGIVGIADATLILQSLTNADEYGLTTQGQYNADVSGNCDGVTALDALEIQRFDAQVIDEFE